MCSPASLRSFVFLMVCGSQAIALAEKPVDFSRDILPILSENCFYCHGPDEKAREADLRLDQREAAIADHGGHIAIVPGKSSESELVKRILSADDDEKMPPPKSNRKLSEEQRVLLKRWIDEGAAWGKHWAFVPPVRPELPKVSNSMSMNNPIDAFVLAKLEANGLSPSPEAAKTTLIRRVTLDLTGLPPTLEEVDAFVADASPDAYERVVDRLLASPRYGERMVWDWLDAARYADTNGYQGDGTRTMWPWRDWAVNAFNANMPFNQFTIEQLAGDQLPSATQEQKLATGFCRNHMINGEGGRIAEENRTEYVFDQLETTATIWLGATFNCCRCHDHKFDPYTRRDYYGLFGFFNNTPVDGGGGNGQTAPVIEFVTESDRKSRDEIAARLSELAKATETLEQATFPHADGASTADAEKAQSLSEDLKSKLRKSPASRGPGEDNALFEFFKVSEPDYATSLEKLKTAKQERDALNNRLVRVMVMEDLPKPRETFILDKGIYNKQLEKTTTALPASLNEKPADVPLNRLALANWLVDRQHPLTSRVIVNRYWQQLFGVGLVKTSEDFGLQGEKPSHPELLDWLAIEFMDSGWDVKRLQRLIVTSSTYTQSSKTNAALVERDPENRLLARGPRYRLPAFMLRDQALSVSGLFYESLGGPGVNPYQPPGVWEEASFGGIRYAQDHGEKLYRRSLYTFWRRIIGPTAFFDSATRQFCTVKTARTNTPLHALATLNDTTYAEAARALAERVMTSAQTPEERVSLAFRLVLARSPSPQELSVLVASVARQQAQFAADMDSAKKLLAVGESKRNESLDVAEHAAFTGMALAILNLDEAVSKE